VSVSSTTPLGAAREHQRGQILVLFAFVLVGLLLISALAVDYGGWLLARRSYQNIADEAAIAGAYQLTTSVTASCAQGAGVTKQACAREAAWQAIQNHIGLPGGATPTSLGATSAASLNVSWSDWTVWVASPPSDAGSAYTGLASSQKTVFVRVQRRLQANLSRVIQSSQTVGAWATAGRIPESFAIVVLCQTSCHGSATDLKINGGSTLILASGDIGSNSYVTTNGSGSYVALGSDSSAYMNQPGQCTTSSSSCQLIAYDGSPLAPDTSIRYSGLALPQVVDPQYSPPGCSGTGGFNCSMSSTAVPWQCNGTGSISMVEPDTAQAPSKIAPNDPNSDPYVLAGAQLPPTPVPVLLGATATVSGQIIATAAAGGAKINGVVVTLNPGGYTATTAGGGSNAGKYSISNVPAGSYTATAVDSAGTYHQISQPLTVTSPTTTWSPTMDKNPILSGTVKDGSGTAIVGATVKVSDGTSTWSATSTAGGAYSIVAQTAAGAGPWTLSTWATDPTTYQDETVFSTGSMAVNTTTTKNHTLHKNPVISGKVEDSSFVAISGATVYVMLGGSTVGTAISAADGTYSVIAQVGSGSGPWSLTTYASATGYASDSPYSVSGSLDATVSNQNHILTANPGTINGTITSGGSPLAGATVTWSLGGTQATSDALGHYTINSAVAGSGVVTASETNYSTGTSSQTLPAGGTLNNVNISLAQAGAISGTVTDSSTGLAIPGQTVTATNGTTTATATTNASGFYTISGLTPSNPKYTVSVAITGYPSTSLNNVAVNSGATTTGENFALYPVNCGSGGQRGNWSCSSSTCGSNCEIISGTCVVGATSSPATESCSKFDASNEIRPGTYNNISIASNTCAWIDPLGSPTGMASGQTAGVVHVQGTFSIGNGATLYGDGVTVVLDSGANMSFSPGSGFVLNYEDDAHTYNGSHFRTGGYIGGGAGSWIGGAGGITYCSGDTDSFANYQRGASFAKSTFLGTWTGSGTSWCYTDTDTSTISPASLGLTWYLRGADTSHGGGRFNSSSNFQFLFNGVLYGPQDDIGLNGSPQQAAAGQIVAWTLTYGGGTNIYQSYNGVEVDGPPYLIEPYIGE